MAMRIPTYERQVEPRRTVGGGIHVAQAEKPESLGKAIAFAAKNALDVYERVDANKTELAAQGAFIRFGDRAREIWMQLQEREGHQAIGATKEHNKILEKEIGDIAGTLENDRQKALFYEYAQKRRGSFLDSVAHYESAQLQKAKDGSIQAQIAEAQNAINLGVSPEMFDEEIDRVTTSIDNLYAKTGAAAAKKMDATQKLVISYLKANAMRVGPEQMSELIDKYQKYISADDVHQLREANKVFEVDQQVEVASRLIEAKDSDPREQLKYAMELAGDLDTKASDKLLGKYKSRVTTFEMSKELDEQDAQEKLDKQAIGLWRAMDIESLEAIASTMPDSDKAMTWLRIVDEVKDGKRNPFMKSDPEKIADFKSRIYKNPSKVSEEDIWKKVGAGLSTVDADALLRIRKVAIEKGVTAESSRALDILQQLRSKKAFDSDPYKNEADYKRVRDSLFDFLENNPGVDPYDTFLRDVIYDETVSTSRKLWDKAVKEVIGDPYDYIMEEWVSRLIEKDQNELEDREKVRGQIKE